MRKKTTQEVFDEFGASVWDLFVTVCTGLGVFRLMDWIEDKLEGP